jgi:hypothetical protein
MLSIAALLCQHCIEARFQAYLGTDKVGDMCYNLVSNMVGLLHCCASKQGYAALLEK